MTTREKTLAMVVAGLGGLLVVAAGLQALFLRPLKLRDKDIANLRSRLASLNQERRAFFQAEDQVKRAAQRTFAATVDEASAKSGELLTRTITHCGLAEADFTRLPVGPRRLRGAQELGWSVQGSGPLERVINLLFLLQQSPWLHKLDGLAFSPGDRPGEVKVRFRFLTLVLTPSPEVEPVELVAATDLNSPERRLLDGIVQRDLLRPYIKRPPPPAPTPGLGTPLSSAGPERYRIVDLSQWQGQPEVAVLDTVTQTTRRYKPGDTLGEGVIVMVDYRPQPHPNRPGLLSHSRVILQIGREYWAIERGRTLADKYKLAPEQWPESLPKL
jgi:hypothetical protein